MCAVQPPSLFCCGVINSRRVLWWSCFWPLIEAPSPLSSPFFPLLSPLTHFLPPSFCLFSFYYPVSPLFLPLPIVTKSFSSSLQTLTPDPSSIAPEVFPGKSRPFLTAHRECLGFTRLSALKLVSPFPYSWRQMLLKSVLVIENHKIKYTPNSSPAYS